MFKRGGLALAVTAAAVAVGPAAASAQVIFNPLPITIGTITLVPTATAQTLSITGGYNYTSNQWELDPGPAYNSSYQIPAVASSGLPLSYSVPANYGGDQQNCSVSPDGVVTFSWDNECTVVIDQAGNSGFAALPTQFLHIYPTLPTTQPTLNQATSKYLYSDGDVSPVSSDIPQSTVYYENVSGACTASGSQFSNYWTTTSVIYSTLHLTDPGAGGGTCNFTAYTTGEAERWIGDVLYNVSPATPLTSSIQVVEPTSQPISFTSTAPNPAKFGSSYVPTTNGGGGSGNPVLLSIDDSSSKICTWDGNKVSFNTVGTCIIDANQAGSQDGFYLPGSAQQTITVGGGGVPQASITSPTPGTTATYTKGQVVPTTFTCASPVGLAATNGCADSNGGSSATGAGTGTLNTSQVGQNQIYSVTAIGKDGQSAVATLVYSVVAKQTPSTGNGSPQMGSNGSPQTGSNGSPQGGSNPVVVAPATIKSLTPKQGQKFFQNQKVLEKFTCTPAAACINSSGKPSGTTLLDTKTLGKHTLVLGAVNSAGKWVSETITYYVIAKPKPKAHSTKH